MLLIFSSIHEYDDLRWREARRYSQSTNQPTNQPTNQQMKNNKIQNEKKKKKKKRKPNEIVSMLFVDFHSLTSTHSW